MDTMIFIGLFATGLLLFTKNSSRIATILWWVVLAATIALLSHHITSGLGLGLTW